VVDSSPAFVSVPAGAFQDDSYATFSASSTVQSRTPMLYFGANDGMLHGVNANTGQEVMGFIPNGGTNGVFSNLYMLASPYYFYHHQFFVDGSPQVSDALLSTDGKWHTVLVGGESAGGSTIYALDVTNPNNFTSDANVASSVLWEFSDSDMGLSYSTPVIARSAAVTVTDKTSSTSTTAAGFAVIFGNGYNSASGNPIFYAVDASTGKQLAKINLCSAVSATSPNACSSTLPNGLSSVSVANSSGVAGVVQDMAYAGDLQGNLWAINMSNSNPSKWTVTLLFQARDGSGNTQPITTAPALTLNPNFPNEFGLMAFFGTGELLTQADLTSTNVQTIYGVWDNTANLTSYAKPYPAPPYTRSNLAQQTVSVVTATVSGTSVKGVTNSANPVNLTFASVSATNPSPPPATITVAPQEGWYFDLSPLGSGTRSFTTLAVDAGGVKFTTNQPPANACAQPNSYFLNVDYRSGSALPTASIGLPNSGVTISSATVNGKAVVLSGVYVTNAYAAAPTSVQSGSGTSVNIISTANGLQTVATQGFQPGRVGWWQVQ
jgi:type IV pilus assembly protein PilY1